MEKNKTHARLYTKDGKYITTAQLPERGCFLHFEDGFTYGCNDQRSKQDYNNSDFLVYQPVDVRDVRENITEEGVPDLEAPPAP